ncbi:MAG TPA: hypothetical protein VJ804_07960, partial [Acidimicrobiales bacterium]|nr:hypothetical protein [Acidimicrobiales bacterium]
PSDGLAPIGCATVEVPPLTPFDDLRLLAARLLFVQLQQERAALQRTARLDAARRALGSMDAG